MHQIANLLSALLGILPFSVGIRVIICLLRITSDPEQEQLYKTRIKNALLYLIIAETVLTTLYALYSYFV